MKRLFLFLLFGFFVACTPAGQITITQAPKPAFTASTEYEQPSFSGISVNLSAGGLAFGIEKLLFRVREVRFENKNNEWTTLTSNAGELSLEGEAKTFSLFSGAKLPVDEWKSVAIVIDHVYAHYNKNAGGPLNVSENERLIVKTTFSVEAGEETMINLSLDTASSIWKDDTGRWFFVPVILAD